MTLDRTVACHIAWTKDMMMMKRVRWKSANYFDA